VNQSFSFENKIDLTESFCFIVEKCYNVWLGGKNIAEFEKPVFNRQTSVLTFSQNGKLDMTFCCLSVSEQKLGIP